MSVKVVIDMNLSPLWVEIFESNGLNAVHWSKVGDPKATDKVIMEWAQRNQSVVFTHDLDFGSLLAVTHAQGPSVIQVRTENVLPEHIGPMVIEAVKKYQSQLERGALIVLDEFSNRVRLLPLNR